MFLRAEMTNMGNGPVIILDLSALALHRQGISHESLPMSAYRSCIGTSDAFLLTQNILSGPRKTATVYSNARH